MAEAEKDHERNLRLALEKARVVSLKFNLVKFYHKLQRVAYCGHLLINEGIRSDAQSASNHGDATNHRIPKAYSVFWE